MIKKIVCFLIVLSFGFANEDAPMQFTIHSKPSFTEIIDCNGKAYYVQKEYFQNTLRLEMYHQDKLLLYGNVFFYENCILNYVYDDNDFPFASFIENNNAWFSPRSYTIKKKVYHSSTENEETIYSAQESYWGTKLNIYDQSQKQIAMLYKPWFDAVQQDWTLVFKDYWAWNTQIQNKKNLYLLLLLCAYEVDKDSIEELKKTLQNNSL